VASKHLQRFSGAFVQDRAARAPAGKWYLHAAPFIASLFSNCATSRAFTLLDLCAEPLFLLAELRCELGAEILGFEHLADLDLSLFARHGIGTALDPIDRLLHFQSQNPATNSLVSANGPSITIRFSPENLTRAPFELGCNPSPASITPAFVSSSLNLPISVSSC
jgi:hypothetical protein